MQILAYVMLAFIGLIALTALSDRRALFGLRCARTISRLRASPALQLLMWQETATSGLGTEARRPRPPVRSRQRGPGHKCGRPGEGKTVGFRVNIFQGLKPLANNLRPSGPQSDEHRSHRKSGHGGCTEVRATSDVADGARWVVGEEQTTSRQAGRALRPRPLSRGPPPAGPALLFYCSTFTFLARRAWDRWARVEHGSSCMSEHPSGAAGLACACVGVQLDIKPSSRDAARFPGTTASEIRLIRCSCSFQTLGDQYFAARFPGAASEVAPDA
jgi:hypothetical protein